MTLSTEVRSRGRMGRARGGPGGRIPDINNTLLSHNVENVNVLIEAHVCACFKPDPGPGEYGLMLCLIICCGVLGGLVTGPAPPFSGGPPGAVRRGVAPGVIGNSPGVAMATWRCRRSGDNESDAHIMLEDKPAPILKQNPRQTLTWPRGHMGSDRSGFSFLLKQAIENKSQHASKLTFKCHLSYTLLHLLLSF